MNKLAQISIFILTALLVISVVGNIFQRLNCKPPIIETVTVVDTVFRIDTVYRELTKRIVVEKPVPVFIDTTANMRTYRDTIYHEYGVIHREEIVLGELLKKDLQIDFKIPEITRTLTVNNTVLKTIRSPLVYGTMGFKSDITGKSIPSFGGVYIPSGHKFLFGAEYGLGGHLNVRVGYAISR